MSKTPEEMAIKYSDLREFADRRLDYKAKMLLEQGFLAGFQAAKDQVADADKVMDTCEHILDMEKMVDVNSLKNSNGWISVKDRLPEVGKVVLAAMPKGTVTLGGIRKKTRAWDVFLNMAICTAEPTHWMPLPVPPKEEK